MGQRPGALSAYWGATATDYRVWDTCVVISSWGKCGGALFSVIHEARERKRETHSNRKKMVPEEQFYVDKGYWENQSDYRRVGRKHGSCYYNIEWFTVSIDEQAKLSYFMIFCKFHMNSLVTKKLINVVFIWTIFFFGWISLLGLFFFTQQ